jgi:hypothetical protein
MSFLLCPALCCLALPSMSVCLFVCLSVCLSVCVEQAPEIHRAFQRDLCKMRLETARAYVKTLSTDGATSMVSGVAPLSLSLSLCVCVCVCVCVCLSVCLSPLSPVYIPLLLPTGLCICVCPSRVYDD